MKKKTLYYVETDSGCCIIAAQDIQQARAQARADEGRHFRSVRKAERKDVAWVRAMGGYILGVLND